MNEREPAMIVFCVFELFPGQPDEDVPLKLRAIFARREDAEKMVAGREGVRHSIETWYVIGE
jgi:hypothetical protein